LGLSWEILQTDELILDNVCNILGSDKTVDNLRFQDGGGNGDINLFPVFQLEHHSSGRFSIPGNLFERLRPFNT